MASCPYRFEVDKTSWNFWNDHREKEGKKYWVMLIRSWRRVKGLQWKNEVLSDSLFSFKVEKSISKAAFTLMTSAAAIVCNSNFLSSDFFGFKKFSTLFIHKLSRLLHWSTSWRPKHPSSALIRVKLQKLQCDAKHPTTATYIIRHWFPGNCNSRWIIKK